MATSPISPVTMDKLKVKNTRITGSEADEEIQVEQRVYLRWIQRQLENESACLQLPFTILLLVSFSMLSLLHLKQDVVFSVEQAIEMDILENANFAFELNFGNKALVDVHSFADFWSWVRLGFIPLIIQPTWSTSERYAEDQLNFFGSNVAPNEQWNFGSSARAIPVTGDYLHYNRIVGGLRFRQQVSTMSDDSCKFPPMGQGERAVWRAWYGKPCMPAWEELPFKPDSLDAEIFDKPERVEWMLTAFMSQEDMIAMAVDMETGCALVENTNTSAGDNGTNLTGCLCKWCASQSPPTPWLREDTQRVEIAMATYNAEYGLITLTSVNLFFSRGSEIQKRVEMMSSWMDPFSFPWSQLIPMLFFDALWVSMLLYVVVTELMEIVHVMRKGEGPHWYHSLWNEYVAFWNIVDWITILVAFIVIFFFFQLLTNGTLMHAALKVVVEAEAQMRAADDLGSTWNRAKYLAIVEDFYTTLDTTISSERSMRLQLCVYPMMVMLRLFKSFAAQARLAVVTDTLTSAAQDLIHFFIVFFGVFFCLCLCSVLFFGQDLEEFATIFRATHTCFRMMFGDWDWDSLDKVRRSVAMIWFSVFMMLMVMILLNMLLAIIMENYMKVKKKMSDPVLAVPLGRQIQEMWRRRQQYKQGKRVRLNDIYDAFKGLHRGNEKEMLNSTQLITPTFLIENVVGIERPQAVRTLTNASEEHRKSTTKEFELGDLRARKQEDDGTEKASQMERLDDATRKVRDGLLYVQDRVTFYDTVVSGEKGQSKDAAGLLANAAAASAQAAADQAISDEVLECVGTEVNRLNYETATILGQTVRRVDLRQRHIEQRQDDMVSSIREMHQTLLNLQSEASSLSNKLQRLNHDAEKGAGSSAWRRGLGGGVVPACLANCTPDAREGTMPGMRNSRTRMPGGGGG